MENSSDRYEKQADATVETQVEKRSEQGTGSAQTLVAAQAFGTEPSQREPYEIKTPGPVTDDANARRPRNSIIPMPMENGKPKHVSPYIFENGMIVVNDFVAEVLPATEQTDLLVMAMNQALNTLRHRLPNLFRARDLLLAQASKEGGSRMMNMYSDVYVNVPRKTDLNAFTSLAIARFLKDSLPVDELSFGVAVAIPPRFVMDFESKIFHFVTTLCINRVNKLGGRSIMENPKKMLFIDVSSPVKHFEDKLVIDKVSNMQNYGMRPYNQTKENHRQNVFARRAFEKLNTWNNRDLDSYSQFLYDALAAPEKLDQFEYNPDLFAEAMMTSLGHGNRITREIRQKLLRALGVKQADSDLLDKLNGGFEGEK